MLQVTLLSDCLHSSLFIVFTRLMWSFDIINATDPQTGVKISIDVDAFSEGFSSHPLPFECSINRRGSWVDAAVELAMDSAKDN